MLVRRGVNGAKSHKIMRRDWKLCERRKHVHSTFWCEPCDVACEKPCADVSGGVSTILRPEEDLGVSRELPILTLAHKRLN